MRVCRPPRGSGYRVFGPGPGHTNARLCFEHCPNSKLCSCLQCPQCHGAVKRVRLRLFKDIYIELVNPFLVQVRSPRASFSTVWLDSSLAIPHASTSDINTTPRLSSLDRRPTYRRSPCSYPQTPTSTTCTSRMSTLNLGIGSARFLTQDFDSKLEGDLPRRKPPWEVLRPEFSSEQCYGSQHQQH